MKIMLVALILIGVSAACFCLAENTFRKIKIKGRVFTVEVPPNIAAKARGLGYRDSMAQDHGMLFTYKDKRMCSFWMKGMRFPIDILWIEDNVIVGIVQNAPIPAGLPLKIYNSSVPVNAVLELNAGTTEKTGISVGDTVTLLKDTRPETFPAE